MPVHIMFCHKLEFQSVQILLSNEFEKAKQVKAGFLELFNFQACQ